MLSPLSKYLEQKETTKTRTSSLSPSLSRCLCYLFSEEKEKKKMPTACLPLYTPAASIITKTLTPKTFSSYPSTSRKISDNYMICRAASSSSTYSSITDFDLYDLLGIDSFCDQSQIKMAYRTLQKRCHPDIAGPAGHDMAIILNEAYSVLSDPNSRLAYDKVSLWLRCVFPLISYTIRD